MYAGQQGQVRVLLLCGVLVVLFSEMAIYHQVRTHDAQKAECFVATTAPFFTFRLIDFRRRFLGGKE